LTVIFCIILFVADVILVNATEGYNGGFYFILLFGILVYYFIPSMLRGNMNLLRKGKKVVTFSETLEFWLLLYI
jgi:hypothetical protein